MFGTMNEIKSFNISSKNYKVGKSLIEENTKEIINNIYNKAERSNCEIVLPEDIQNGKFVMMRRSSDVSNHSDNGSFIPAPSPGKHDDKDFGTHHARDAHDL